MHRFLAAVVLASAALLPAAAGAQNLPERAAWGPNHPFALGARLSARGSSYALAGFGGQLRLRPWRRLIIELYADNFVGSVHGALRHDHEVGGSLQYAIAGNDRWSLQPLLGACAMLAVQDAPQSSQSSVNDIHFGIHAGLGAEVALGAGFAFEAQAELIGYVGHDFTVYRWSTEVAPSLSLMWVAQANAGLNYYF